MLQLAGLGDTIDDTDPCVANPNDEVCQAFQDANEIQFEEDCARRGGCDDAGPPSAGIQEVLTGQDAAAAYGAGYTRPAAQAAVTGKPFPWKTVGTVVGVVAGLGAIGYVVARR